MATVLLHFNGTETNVKHLRGEVIYFSNTFGIMNRFELISPLFG